MPTPKASIPLVLLRLVMGWYLLVDGYLAVTTPNWSAQGFLLSAKTFPTLYAWFAEPAQLWWVNPINAWGVLLIGVALLLGVFVRPAAWAGAILMLLYYFPQYHLPKVPHGYIVEEHIIWLAVFIVIATIPAAQSFGLSRFLRKTFLGRLPVVWRFL